MTDKNMTYYSLTTLGQEVLYFSTERKLAKWKKRNPDNTQGALKNEIPLSVAKELIKLSKKKPKEKCPECGK